MSKLSDLIQHKLEQLGWSELSVRDLAQLTVDHTTGKPRLSKDTIAVYRRGTHGVPDEVTLQAWSEMLDVSIEELRAAAKVLPGEPDPYIPPPEAARMNRRQREAVTELIRAMVETARGTGEVRYVQKT